MKRLAGFLLLFFLYVPACVADPIMVLATGQSNDGIMRPFQWVADSNAKILNVPLSAMDGVDGGVGTAFVPIDGALSMSLCGQPMCTNPIWKFASEIARQNPGHPVCVVNVFFGGRANNYWLSGYMGYPVTVPDIWHNIEINMTPGLALCGATRVDFILDSQGESNAGDPNYLTDLQVKLARFKTEPWYTAATRIILFGVAGSNQWRNVTPANGAPYDAVNAARLAAAQSDPLNRQFVPFDILPWPAYWDAGGAGLPHVSALGIDALGSLAANVAQDFVAAWTSYVVTLSCGNTGGAITAAVPTGRFKLLPGKMVAFQINSGISNPGNCGSYLKASVPFPMSGNFFSASSYDAGLGTILSAALAGTSDATTVHVFGAAGYPNFPAGQPTLTGIYERQ